MKKSARCIVYDKNYYAVMANDIIKGKQEMTLTEARLIRLLITQVVREDKDLTTYTCRIQDLAKFLGIRGEWLYREVKTICENLLQRIIRIGSGDPRRPWKTFQWVQLAEYDGNGNITLQLSNQIAPYVLELDKWFTQYQLKEILAFNSYYAIRLYELIKCHEGITRSEKGAHEFDIPQLRDFFCCEDKYATTAVFIKKVIDIAIREISEKSDISLSYETVKTGKKITSIVFTVWHKPKRAVDEGLSTNANA